ncbi:MAG TPA: hypothetical protein VK741_25720 [Acetobacteraceae bacterium]|jgi:hypothetical protein|nr:hypothetical protein [Acetobacteraceae bacterium]
MIKATGRTESGRKVLILGLSFANLKRLQAGDEIAFDATPYGYDGEIVIMAKRDEQTLAAMVRRNNPDVVEHKEPGAP